jgi:hypothetical protein
MTDEALNADPAAPVLDDEQTVLEAVEHTPEVAGQPIELLGAVDEAAVADLQGLGHAVDLAVERGELVGAAEREAP